MYRTSKINGCIASILDILRRDKNGKNQIRKNKFNGN